MTEPYASDHINERHALEAALNKEPQEMLRHLEVLPPERLEWLAIASRELHKIAFRLAYQKRETEGATR